MDAERAELDVKGEELERIAREEEGLLAEARASGMSAQQITPSLPDGLYEQLQTAAERSHRSLDELLVEVVAAIAPALGTASSGVRSSLAQVAYLNDAALWQAARSTMAPEQRARLSALHDKQQRSGLDPKEKADEQALLSLYDETLLVRAQAAVLLKQRGYDVANPEQFQPLG
jgi:hypothetical protein